MKRNILLASALGLALQVGVITRAFAVTPPPDDQDSTEGHHHGGPGARMDAMAARLKLTPEQRKTLEAAFKERMDKMKALQEEFMARRKTVVDASDSKITAVLNADQKAEFAKMKDEMEKRREEFKSHRRDHNE